jgi:hypothetical protein
MNKTVDAMKAAAEAQSAWHPLPFNQSVLNMDERQIDQWLDSIGEKPTAENYAKVSAMMAHILKR